METSNKIPKKPFYRIVKFDKHLITFKEVQERLQGVQKRLWKMQACHLRDERLLLNWKELRRSLYGPTIKKSLKNMKRLSVSQPVNELPRRFIHQISSAVRNLDTLRIQISNDWTPIRIPIYQKINPQLQKCYLGFSEDRSETPISHSLQKFRRFPKCILYASRIRRFEREILCLAMETQRIKSPRLPIERSSIQDYFLVNSDCIKEINASSPFQDTIFHFPILLPNLKALNLSQTGDYNSQVERNFSFIENYHAIESLQLHLTYIETDTLDCLQSLSRLKSFHFESSKGPKRTGPVRKIPTLTGLEHLSIHLEEIFKPKSMFDMENVQEAILSNQNLKSLELRMDIQEMGQVLTEDLELKVEKLVIIFVTTEKPYAQAAKNIAAFLKNHPHIKNLSFVFPQCFSDLNHLLFKPIGTIDSLEELKLTYKLSGGLEDNKFKGVKDALTPNSSLTSFELYLGSEGLNAPAFNSLVDACTKLKNLQKFAIQGTLTKITNASFVKFFKFLENIHHNPSIGIALNGFAQKEINQINDLLGTKYSLSNKRNNFTFFFEY